MSDISNNIIYKTHIMMNIQLFIGQRNTHISKREGILLKSGHGSDHIPGIRINPTKEYFTFPRIHSQTSGLGKEVKGIHDQFNRTTITSSKK